MAVVLCNVCGVLPRGSDTFACHPCRQAIRRTIRRGLPRSGSHHRCFCDMCGSEYFHVVGGGGSFERCCSRLCRRRMHQIKCTFGLSAREYRDLWGAQAGLCAMPLCFEPLDFLKCCVDHDHSTGVVRGLLCFGCNISLGHHEKALALGASEYLAQGVISEDA